MLDDGWRAIEMRHLNDPGGIDWKLQHRDTNIHTDTYSDVVSIKISRDSKSERIYSAAYMRTADMKDGGTYQVSIH